MLPDQYRKRADLIRRIRHTYESFGFEGMDTPAVESLAVLLGKGGGENEKLMFRVLKRGAELERARAGGGELADLALRFDLTVPLARYYATHRAALPAVFKRYQIGPVWRAERPQYGRFREFGQCDVDVLGSASMAVEAEVILAAATALGDLGFDGPVVANSRPLLARPYTRGWRTTTSAPPSSPSTSSTRRTPGPSGASWRRRACRTPPRGAARSARARARPMCGVVARGRGSASARRAAFR